MFLNEVALGTEKHIRRDDSSLVKAPPGFDCVVARGRNEPGNKKACYYTLRVSEYFSLRSVKGSGDRV